MLIWKNNNWEKIYSVSQVWDKLNELKQLRISTKQYLQSCIDQSEFDNIMQEIKTLNHQIDNLKWLKVDDRPEVINSNLWL